MNYICPKCKTVMMKDSKSPTVACLTCRVKESGADHGEAYINYCRKIGLPALEPVESAVAQSAAALVPKKDNFVEYARQNIGNYTMGVKSFMTQSAVEKLLTNNAKYITTEPLLDKLWTTEEGAQSLIDAFNESIGLAAELPTLGYIIPFGNTATFIPRVEAFQNVLTNGANAPFEWLNIEAIHEKDKVKMSRKNGSFNIEFENIGFFDRGEVVGVAVYGYHKASHMIVGESYEASRLFEKGTASSPAYKLYRMNVDFYNRMGSEGKLKMDKDGRQYAPMTMEKKGGGTWEKRIYREDLENPYENAHREEMLKKVAGKTFLNPYIKQRIGSVIVEEMQDRSFSVQNGAEKSVSMAEEQFSPAENEDSDCNTEYSAENGIIVEPPEEDILQDDEMLF